MHWMDGQLFVRRAMIHICLNWFVQVDDPYKVYCYRICDILNNSAQQAQHGIVGNLYTCIDLINFRQNHRYIIHNRIVHNVELSTCCFAITGKILNAINLFPYSFSGQKI